MTTDRRIPVMTELKRLIDEVHNAFAPVLSVMQRARLGDQLAELLATSSADLNRRATVVIRCTRGAVCYRVFDIPNIGLLGVPAGETWVGGQAQRWTTRPEWIPRRSSAADDDTVTGRCRCCPGTTHTPTARIYDAITSGRRNIRSAVPS